MIVELKEDPETGELYFNIPDEMLEQLGWQEGDTLVWEIQDQSVSVKKKDSE